MPHKLAIIGAGSVGAAICYAALLKKVASEILLVDVDTARCEAQVLDISDAAFLSETKVSVGNFKEAGQSDIIVITAGAKQRPGETRVELIDRNYAILKSCIDGMKPFNPEAVILIVSNPVDILTFFAQKLSGLPTNQVFGSGTFLDTARLRLILSEKMNVSETACHAYVLGEHGDSQFVAWSSAHVGTTPLLSYPEMKNENLEAISTAVKNKAYTIINALGFTCHGIGGCAASICESVFNNTRQVRPVSHFIEDLGVCISMPAAIGSHGIVKTLRPPLDPAEEESLRKSAAGMRAVIEKYQK